MSVPHTLPVLPRICVSSRSWMNYLAVSADAVCDVCCMTGMYRMDNVFMAFQKVVYASTFRE